jgi:hypothetical protein
MTANGPLCFRGRPATGDKRCKFCPPPHAEHSRPHCPICGRATSDGTRACKRCRERGYEAHQLPLGAEVASSRDATTVTHPTAPATDQGDHGGG